MKTPFIKGHIRLEACEPAIYDGPDDVILDDINSNVRIYLDGKPVQSVLSVSCNNGLGSLCAYKYDANGKLIHNKLRDEFETYTVFGRVQVVDPRMHQLEEVYLR